MELNKFVSIVDSSKIYKVKKMKVNLSDLTRRLRLLNFSNTNYQDIANKIFNIIKKQNDESPEIDGIKLGSQNCMLCTWCTELQIRNIDRLPRPVYSPRDIIFNEDIKAEKFVKNPKRLKISDLNDVINKVEQFTNSRYYCHVKWKKGNGGHEFLLINNNNLVYLLDSQAALYKNIFETNYFDNIKFSESYLVRIDDKELD